MDLNMILGTVGTIAGGFLLDGLRMGIKKATKLEIDRDVMPAVLVGAGQIVASIVPEASNEVMLGWNLLGIGAHVGVKKTMSSAKMAGGFLSKRKQ